MKKVLLTILSFFLVIAVGATPVTREKAKQYAEDYLNARLGHQVTMKSVERAVDGGYYIVNFYPEGWVIVSGDDVASPLIGYSKTGSLNSWQIPSNMQYALDRYAQEVHEVARVVREPNPRWQQASTILIKGDGQSVDPLVKVHWDQPAPFNKYCPMGKALVGCVAVAMSQAMSVHRYPDRPQGSMSYRHATYGTIAINYDEQKAYNWNQIMNGANNYDEVARLLAHAGIAVQMDYGEDGSGVPVSQLGRVVTALTTNFKYPKTVRQVRRDTYDGNWEQLLKNELNAGRVVIYNGLDTKQSSGHSWDIDGFNADGLFHCNWGWGGYGDGYFTLNNLGYGTSHFDATHIAVIGIGVGDQPLRSIELSSYDIEESLPAGAVVGQITVNEEPVANGLTVSVHGTYSRSTGKYQTVPFVYDNGLLKTTEPLTKGKEWTLEITVSDGEHTLTQGFVIKVTDVLDLATATSLSYDRATQTFTLITKNNVNYSLKNASGSIIGSGLLSPLPQLQFERSQLTEGENVLTLSSQTESISLTIKK